MNAKIIEGLKAVRNGIDLILEGVESEKSANTTAPVKNEGHTPDSSANPVPEGEVTREMLDGMTYNNIKKLAKEIGVPAVGSREEIISKILGVEKTEEAPEEVDEDDEDITEDESVDPLYDKVISAVADLDNEEIADILVDVGISAKGKRESLIEKLVQAVRDGLLDFEDDEETEEAEEAPAPKKEKKEKKSKKAEEPTPAPLEEEEDEEEDDTNDVDNPNMTAARKKAIIAKDEKIRKLFKSGKITRKMCVEFLQNFYDTEDSLDDMSDEEILDTYIDAVCRLIDDEGDLIEDGAYELNGQPACCGRVLAYSEDTECFICEHCGEEYEAE